MERKTPWKIYISRALSGWGDRLWAFGGGIFMNLIAPENLRLVAIYGFATSISVIIFGALIGYWVDQTTRLRAAQVFLAVQNLMVTICCVFLAAFFWGNFKDSWPSWLIEATPAVAIFLAVIANLASVGYQIAVEKDWIVVIAGDDNDLLAKMNSMFRTIDLLCLLISPSLAGLVFDYLSYAWAAVFIAVWNILSVIVEYYLLIAIYKEYPGLSFKNFDESDSTSSNVDINGAEVKGWSFYSILRSTWVSIVSSFMAWVSYMKHSIRNAGLGLAFLYMTVLGFDNITWGYCLSQCVTKALLGGMVGVSAIFGVAGSLTFPYFRRKFGLNSTGVIGTFCQITALSMCVVSIWLPGSPFGVPHYDSNAGLGSEATTSDPFDAEVTLMPDADDLGRGEAEIQSCYVSSFISVALFLSGIIAARFGLWLIDLTITQILQEKVEEQKRGVINGVQNSLNSLMNTIKFVLVIVLPEIETFGWLIICSFSFVVVGGILYSSYAFVHREKPKVGAAKYANELGS